MKLVKTSVKRPVGVIMIVLAIIALGVVSFRNLAVDLFPDIELPIAVVATSYEEAAPQDVENLISRPIESAVSTVEGIEMVQSQSQPGSSLVVMMFDTDTDLDQALLNIRESVDQVSGMLPEQAGEPNIMRFNPDQLPVIWVGLTGDNAENLTEVADDQVVPFFERQEGVGSVTLEGGRDREIQLVLDQSSLDQYGVTAQNIIQALNSTNQSGSVGTVERGNQDLQLRVSGEFDSIDDIKQTIVQNEAGTAIHVEDVAEVRDSYKEESNVTLVNGEPALVLSVLKQTDANTVNVATTIQESMEEIQANLPADVNLEVIIDTSEFIQLSIDSVVQNIIIGGAISFFVLLLFLKSLRATFVIGLSIPIAIISAFAMLYFTGETLNILTLGGLALGIGMVVDSSIVILEHIFTYRQRGYSLKEAAIEGASELTPAIIASTTTTLVVFLPIVFVGGIASDLFTPLALAVSFSLIASLVVAITLVPMLSSKMLRKIYGASGRRYWFDRLLGWTTGKYKGILRRVLKYRKTTIAGTILAIIASLALVPMIGAEFIPAADQGQMEIRVETRLGSSLEYTEGMVEQVNERLEDYESFIETSFVTIGSAGFGTGNQATYTMQLIPAGERDQSTTEIARDMDEDFRDIAGAEITVNSLDGGMGLGDPIQIQVSGPEHEVVNELSEQVIEEISQVEGIFNPESSATDGVPQMNIHVDHDAAAMYGLTQEQVLSQVRLQFTQQVATQYREDGQEMDVSLMFPKGERSTINDLQDMNIQTPTGTAIPLAEVAEFEETLGPVALSRQNQQPQMNISSDIVDRDLGSIVSDVEQVLDNMSLPEGYSFEMGGQAQDMNESFTDLAIALVFSIFLVYAVMAIQFENFLFPFIIMFAMPTSIIGVLLGLFVTGIPLSIPGFIGIIMLAGIVVNNSIVLVDYINILRRKGKERYEAIVEAGASRLRPILMTTLTTILAMVPLGLALGEGAEMQQPLAVTIIFGLTVSSMFTLILIPVIYSLFDDLTAKIVKRKNKKA
ncbi:efflux RND transporter permease subunit [Virgibacillus sp. YIM 98842]|uniref:efflux RND transporter permease subunit n=1 Tax=Virgibacillus sp. YIM 98842 TaxID=2663533 RepID=UPI0013D9DFB3|nr:efflux RND transporter permease subunit [Virgibacillus sp. YIM 98842]